MRLFPARLAAVLTTLALLVLTAQPLRADSVDGKWNGELSAYGNYFLETSTRVILPDLQLRMVSPKDVRLEAGYMVDVITSASIAQGVTEDDLHTELRHSMRATVGKEFDAALPFDLQGGVTYSTEPDYKSWLFNLRGKIFWEQRLNELTLGLRYNTDTVLKNSDPDFEEPLQGFSTSLFYTRVITPTVLWDLGYDFGYLNGFMANAYRNALIGPLPYAENHPGERIRHNLLSRLRIFIPKTQTGIHIFYRAYLDNWDIAAITPSLRIYQHLTERTVLRLRVRHYQQTQANFCSPTPGALCSAYPADYPKDGYVTADPKMTAFRATTLGGRLELSMDFFEDTFMNWAAGSYLDFSVNHTWNTNSFGNYWVGQIGGRIPF